VSSPKIIFLATAPFAVPSLKLLAKSDYCPLAVVTRPDRPSGRGKKFLSPPVKKTAAELGLEVLQPKGKEELYWVVEQAHPDIIINVAYGMILPARILEHPVLGCVNVHPSLLPNYRGAAPVRRAIMAGEQVTGVSVMYMAEEMDAGDIILQEQVLIAEEETYGMLHDRLAQVGAELLQQALNLLQQGIAPRIPQEEEKATYAPPLAPEDEILDWSQTAEAIYNQVRGMEPSPGVYTWFSGKRLKLRKVIPVHKPGQKQGDKSPLCSETGQHVPGTVCWIEKDNFLVAAGQGYLKITELQPEGKKRISAGDFLRGYNLQVGDTLG